MVLLVQAGKLLDPTEKGLDDVSTIIKPLKPQLDELKELLRKTDQKAEDAKDNADNAEKEAGLAVKVKELL